MGQERRLHACAPPPAPCAAPAPPELGFRSIPWEPRRFLPLAVIHPSQSNSFGLCSMPLRRLGQARCLLPAAGLGELAWPRLHSSRALALPHHKAAPVQH